MSFDLLSCCVGLHEHQIKFSVFMTCARRISICQHFPENSILMFEKLTTNKILKGCLWKQRTQKNEKDKNEFEFISDSCIALYNCIFCRHYPIMALLTGSPIRDPGSFKTYDCNNGATDESPQMGVSNCTINDDQFRTLIEHGDW